jgi:hypothetical protein
VQLEDSQGDPALARRVTNVTITSSNSTLLAHVVGISIPEGSDYGLTQMPVTNAAAGTLTATSAGLISSTAQFSSSDLPFQATLSPASPSILSNETDSLSIAVSALGKPLPGVDVAWSASSGSVSPQTSTTDSTGATQAVFKPSGKGPVTIVADLSSPVFGQNNLTASVVVMPRTPGTDPILGMVLTLGPYVAGAAAAAVLVFFFIRRRRRRGGEEETTEEGYESMPM